MNIHITNIHNMARESTAQIAQNMVADIAVSMGFKEIGVYSYNISGEDSVCRRYRFDGMIASLSRGDVVFLQLPTWNTTLFDKEFVSHLKVYHARLIIFVHDVIALMFPSNYDLLDTLIEIYNQAEVLIVPSLQMQEYLLTHGVRQEMKFVIQEIWDYTFFPEVPQSVPFQRKIHFVGNPEKFKFLKDWTYDVPVEVYSNEFCEAENVHCRGWMPAYRLYDALTEGGFGLLWYGNDYWKQYMGYNCSFKLSTSLAAGLPVIAPRGISNETLIEKNHLGLLVNSLDEAVDIVRNISEKEYHKYETSVKEFAPLLQGGFFTKRILNEAMHALLREDTPVK